MRRLFVCERPYALYKTIIRCVNDTANHNDIVISNHVDGIERIYPIIKNENIFDNVFFYDDYLYKEFYSFGTVYAFRKFPKGMVLLLKKLKKYIDLQKKAADIDLPNGLDFDQYDEIYVNDAASTIMLYLCAKRKSFIWMEHSKDIYKAKLEWFARVSFGVMAILEKLGVVYALHGRSKWVKAIEVNDNHDLNAEIRKKEIRELNIDRLLEQMSDEDKNRVFELYIKAYDIAIDTSKPVYLFLTAPLYLDGLVCSEEEQMDVYTNLIMKKAGTFQNVLVKPHPRDTVSPDKYMASMPGVIAIDSCVSAEVLGLAKMRYEGVYGIRTSTVAAFTNAKHAECYSAEQVRMFLT